MSCTASSKNASYSGLSAAICVGVVAGADAGATLIAGAVGAAVTVEFAAGKLVDAAATAGFCAQALLVDATKHSAIRALNEGFMLWLPKMIGEQ